MVSSRTVATSFQVIPRTMFHTSVNSLHDIDFSLIKGVITTGYGMGNVTLCELRSFHTVLGPNVKCSLISFHLFSQFTD